MVTISQEAACSKQVRHERKGEKSRITEWSSSLYTLRRSCGMTKPTRPKISWSKKKKVIVFEYFLFIEMTVLLFDLSNIAFS